MKQLEIETSLKRRSRVILSLAGSLRASHIGKLLMLVESARGMGMRVTLSLARLKSADQEAVRGILNWRDREVRILHCPEYVREWLRTETEVHESATEAVQPDGTVSAAVHEGRFAGNTKEAVR